jgi:competence CoiA-like predicted nuclease
LGYTGPMTHKDPLDFDALENAGHDFVLVSPVMQGLSHYMCENCGTLMVSYQGDRIEIWHHPHRQDRACEPRRSTGQTLYQKIQELHARQFNRMQNV